MTAGDRQQVAQLLSSAVSLQAEEELLALFLMLMDDEDSLLMLAALPRTSRDYFSYATYLMSLPGSPTPPGFTNRLDGRAIQRSLDSFSNDQCYSFFRLRNNYGG